MLPASGCSAPNLSPHAPTLDLHKEIAALWYRRAIDYLPSYVKARVHLAEIYASQGQGGDAEMLLLPALSSGDPEVRWRLADVLSAQARFEEAESQLGAARIPPVRIDLLFFGNLHSRHRRRWRNHS